ncbi:chorismate mutase [Streptomyces sp. NRRL F-4489]|uniref:chorismate mutase n=1 Tax=Streptomyces sp. NRRL F-4489 TaxID=1609095 RepID=UPI000747B47E|nr:chorismate mutase [Streptomyces sp. NRRL F-4489]KUL38420.1 chorismate mutase [Streptomyces sp. NRRL F-4489]
MRRALIAGTAAAVLATGAGSAVAAPTPGTATAAAARTSTATPGRGTVVGAPGASAGQLRALVALAAERLATADPVAAAKWGTGSPIDDPAREQQVLADVAAQARALGADPDATVRVFRDQIEASKLVQRGLHRRWTADPAQAPTTRPDLAQVREEINRINGELVRALAASPRARTAPGCTPRLAADALQLSHRHHLDALHTAGLARALRSVCGA